MILVGDKNDPRTLEAVEAALSGMGKMPTGVVVRGIDGYSSSYRSSDGYSSSSPFGGGGGQWFGLSGGMETMVERSMNQYGLTRYR
jgi:hypothetical protein